MLVRKLIAIAGLLFGIAFPNALSANELPWPLEQEPSVVALEKLKSAQLAVQKNYDTVYYCQQKKSCSKQQVSDFHIQNTLPNISYVTQQCNLWIFNKVYPDTPAGLHWWSSGPAEYCDLSYMLESLDLQAERGVRWFDVIGKTSDLYGLYQQSAMHHFATSLIDSFPEFRASVDQDRHPMAWQQFSLFFKDKLGFGYKQKIPVAALEDMKVQIEAGDSFRAGNSVCVKQQRERIAATNERFKRLEEERIRREREDRLIPKDGVLGFFLGIVADDLKYMAEFEKNMFLVPGRATFNGFTFGETPAGAAVEVYRDNLTNRMAQAVLGYASGVKREYMVDTSASGVSVRCWDFFPRFRATPMRTTCLYMRDGILIGGRFTSNENDPGLVRYIQKQGFQLARSRGMQELRIPMRNDEYIMDDMRVNHKIEGIRYDNDGTYYESEFCFFPSDLREQLGPRLTCTVIAL